MALTAALLGWMFDGAEMGLFSMVGNAALEDLLAESGRADQAGRWFGIIIATFLIGAATGGVLFGWLGDRIGRVRAMSLSVAVYAIFTGLCGLVSSAEQLAVLRFIASLGMGGEWSLGVALVMEVWPNKSRAFMAGLIGAAANVGYLLVGIVGIQLNSLLGEHIPAWLGAVGMSSEQITTLTAYKGWRIMLLLGAVPALLTFLIRLFVPESHKWEEAKRQGGTSNWVTSDLLGVLLGAIGPVCIILVWAYDTLPLGVVNVPLPMFLKIIVTLIGLVVAAYGYTYPVMQYIGRSYGPENSRHETRKTLKLMLLGAGLSGVALLGTWGSTQWAVKWAGELTNNEHLAREYTQIWLALGACTGTILAAMMGDWFGRRTAYFLLCILALASSEFLYQFNTEYNTLFLFSVFLAGTFTASFYGWLPLYLPELFATRVRATGQGFSFNFGRILAAVGSLQTGVLLTEVFDGSLPKAGALMSFIYVIGMVLIWFCPETKGKPLPE